MGPLSKKLVEQRVTKLMHERSHKLQMVEAIKGEIVSANLRISKMTAEADVLEAERRELEKELGDSDG